MNGKFHGLLFGKCLEYVFFPAQVETYGSMEKKEKVEFILEQMRLCVAVKDYIRCHIISKKINTKFFQEDGNEVRERDQ